MNKDESSVLFLTVYPVLGIVGLDFEKGAFDEENTLCSAFIGRLSRHARSWNVRGQHAGSIAESAGRAVAAACRTLGEYA